MHTNSDGHDGTSSEANTEGRPATVLGIPVVHAAVAVGAGGVMLALAVACGAAEVAVAFGAACLVYGAVTTGGELAGNVSRLVSGVLLRRRDAATSGAEPSARRRDAGGP
jgi:hypothetical protein